MAPQRPGPSWVLTGGFLAAALLIGVSLVALEVNGVASPLDRIEKLTLDGRFLLSGARPTPVSVIIVAIDDEALSEAGGDTPTREMMVRIVQVLAGLNPRSIAIDVAFLKPRDAKTPSSPAPSRRRLRSSRRSANLTRSFPAEKPNRATWR